MFGIVSSTSRRGAEVFASDLFGELAGRGHDCHLAALEAGSAPAITVADLGHGRWDPVHLLAMARRARGYDVVVGFGSSSLAAGALVSLLARRPFVYRSIGDPAAWADVRWRALRIGLPARRAARIVALYPAAGRAWERIHAVSPTRITSIPNAASAYRFAPVSPSERLTARRRFGLSADLRWVGFVGSLTEEKRPLDAVAVVSGDPSLGLLVVGSGPLGAAVEAAANACPDRIRMLGAQSDLGPVYAAIDAVLITSRTEGMPGVAIEAGLCALPVVATDVGGVPEVVVDGVTGALFAVGDVAAARTALATVADEAASLGAAARRHCAERFGLDVVTDAWEELLVQVATGGPRSG